jgi:hypothetical protein
MSKQGQKACVPLLLLLLQLPLLLLPLLGPSSWSRSWAVTLSPRLQHSP